MESSYIEHIFNHKLYLDYKELCELTLYITKYKLDSVKLIKIINELNKIIDYVSDNITDKTLLNNKYKINLQICDIFDYQSRKQQILLKNNIECQLMIYYKNLDEIKHKCISYVNDLLHKGIFINYIQEHLYDYYYYSRKNKDVEINIFYYITALMYNILYCIRAEECDDTVDNKKYYINMINLLDKINILLNIYQTNINDNNINQFNYIQNICGNTYNNDNIYLYCSTILLPNIYNLMLYILFNKYEKNKNEDFNKLLTIKIIKNVKEYNFKQLFDELYKDIVSKLEK